MQQQSVEDTLNVLRKSLKTVPDKSHFIVNLYSLHPILNAPGKPFLPQGKSFAPSQAEQLPKFRPQVNKKGNDLDQSKWVETFGYLYFNIYFQMWWLYSFVDDIYHIVWY